MARRQKNEAMRRHARRRARERFGVELTLDRELKLVEQVQEGAKLLQKQSCRVGLYLVTFAGIEVVVAYDRSRQQIVTLMHLKEWNKIT